MLRCGKAPAELMHMHEVELLPLGDTDVTTLGKWLSNHDNMAQCCILLGRTLRMASLSCRQDGDSPSARSTVSGWWQSASGDRGLSTLASIWPLCPHSGAWRGSQWFVSLDCSTQEQWETIPIGDSKGCWDIQPKVLQVWIRVFIFVNFFPS